MDKPVSVEAYLAGLPEAQRTALQRLRKAIRTAIPEATEGIAWQMPAFKVQGRWLVGYAAFRGHCSLFPMSATVVKTFAADLAGYTTTKGSIHFTAENPLPAALVRKMVEARVQEVASRSRR